MEPALLVTTSKADSSKNIILGTAIGFPTMLIIVILLACLTFVIVRKRRRRMQRMRQRFPVYYEVGAPLFDMTRSEAYIARGVSQSHSVNQSHDPVYEDVLPAVRRYENTAFLTIYSSVTQSNIESESCSVSNESSNPSVATMMHEASTMAENEKASSVSYSPLLESSNTDQEGEIREYTAENGIASSASYLPLLAVLDTNQDGEMKEYIKIFDISRKYNILGLKIDYVFPTYALAMPDQNSELNMRTTEILASSTAVMNTNSSVNLKFASSIDLNCTEFEYTTAWLGDYTVYELPYYLGILAASFSKLYETAYLGYERVPNVDLDQILSDAQLADQAYYKNDDVSWISLTTLPQLSASHTCSYICVTSFLPSENHVDEVGAGKHNLE